MRKYGIGIMTVGALLTSCLWGAPTGPMGHSDDCNRALGLPSVFIFHDDVESRLTLENAASVREEIVRALKRTPERNAYRLTPGEFVTRENFTRPQLVSLGRAIEMFRWLLFFESDFVAEHTNCTENFQFRDTKPTYMELLNYRPYRAPNEELVEKYSGRSEKSWTKEHAQEVFEGLESEYLEHKSFLSPYSEAQILQAQLTLMNLEARAGVPPVFLSTLRHHAEMAKNSGAKPTRYYYALIEALDKAFPLGVGTH